MATAEEKIAAWDEYYSNGGKMSADDFIDQFTLQRNPEAKFFRLGDKSSGMVRAGEGNKTVVYTRRIWADDASLADVAAEQGWEVAK